MPNQSDSANSSEDSAEQPLPALIKTYIDERLKESKRTDDHSAYKSWKRSWRSTSPITKATLVLTAGVAFATIAYAIIAAIQLQSMEKTYKEISKQTNVAQHSQYMACLSAQAAQLSLRELEKGTALSRSATQASIVQAAAGIEAQRSILMFLAGPASEAQSSETNLKIPFTVKNDGKSVALSVTIRANAVLVNKGEKFQMNSSIPVILTSQRIPAGYEFPEKPTDARYQPMTESLSVSDISGRSVPLSSDGAKKLISASDDGATIAFVYGRLAYTDFSGKYEEKFCAPIFSLQPGRSHVPTSNETTCAKYNQQEETRRLSTEMPPKYAGSPDIPIPVCVVPK